MYHLSVDENLGYKAIADRLAEKGYLRKAGGPFASYTIQRILGNEAIAGTLTYGKRPRKGNPKQELVRLNDFFPAILSKDEWEKLQGRLAIRRQAVGFIYFVYGHLSSYGGASLLLPSCRRP